MSTKSADMDDRYPTRGPDASEYERYSHVTTDEDVILYDGDNEEAWIQADDTLALREWR